MRDYKPLSYRRLRDLSFSRATIFDIRAYRWNRLRTARKLFPEARIIMVEGQADLAAPLRKVAAELGNARAHNRVLAADTGLEVDFYTMGTASSINPERSNPARAVTRAHAATLDHIWQERRSVSGSSFRQA